MTKCHIDIFHTQSTFSYKQIGVLRYLCVTGSALMVVTLRAERVMNQQELDFVMAEIEVIIEQLADCQFCHKAVHDDNLKMLKQLFRMKLERACALKKVG